MHVDIFSVLALYCRNYRILADSGYNLKMPIALVFEDITEASKVIKEIDPDAEVYHTLSKGKDFQESILLCESPGFFWKYPYTTGYRSVKSLEQIEILFQATNFNKLGQHEIDVAIFMIFENFIPDEFSGKVFEVYIEKGINVSDSIERLIPVPAEKDIPFILRRLTAKTDASINPMICAAEFLYPYCMDTGREDEYNLTVTYAKALIDMSEDYCQSEDLVDSVINHLTDAIDSGQVNVVKMTTLDIESVDIETCAYFYKEHIYIADMLFKKAIASLTNKSRIGKIKAALVLADILCGKIGHYTTKLYFRVNGVENPKRMLKLKTHNVPRLACCEYK